MKTTHVYVKRDTETLIFSNYSTKLPITVDIFEKKKLFAIICIGVRKFKEIMCCESFVFIQEKYLDMHQYYLYSFSLCSPYKHN